MIKQLTISTILLFITIYSCTHEIEKANSTENTSDINNLERAKIDKGDENYVYKDTSNTDKVLLVENTLFSEECTRELEIDLNKVDSSNIIFTLLQSNQSIENIIITYKSRCNNEDFSLNETIRPAITKIKSENSTLSKQLFEGLIDEYKTFRNNELGSIWNWKAVQKLFKSGLVIFTENEMLYIIMVNHCGNEAKFVELSEIIKQNFTKKNSFIVNCGGNPAW